MSTSKAVPALSTIQREVLLEHLDGIGRRYVYGGFESRSQVRADLWKKFAAQSALVERKLLAWVGRRTVVTYEGRRVMAMIIADYADFLTRALEATEKWSSEESPAAELR